MEDDEWQELSDALLGDAAEFEAAGAGLGPGLGEQLLMPGAGMAMDIDEWDRLANELLDAPAASDESMHGDHGQGDQELLGVLPPSEPQRKRGRPPGTYGSRTLREACAQQALQQAADSADVVVGPEPGTIAYARQMKKQKKSAAASAAGASAEGQEVSLSLPLPGMAANIWNSLKTLASGAAQTALVYTAAAASVLRGRKATGQNPAAEASEDRFLEAVFQDDRELLTQTQFASKCGLNKDTAASLFVSAASAALEGGRVLWGAFFRALDARLLSEEPGGAWIPVMLCHRCRYDETPTLTRLRARQCKEMSSASDVSKHGKVVQSEGSIHVLLAGSDRKKFLEFTGRVPTTLQVVEDTSAVCLRRVRCNVLGIDSIPDMLSISRKFPWTLQQATVDRYAANFKAESALLHDVLAMQDDGAPLTTKATLPCDVHRIHQAHASSFKIVPDDISGLLSASLCQHAGSLDKWREILSTVLEQRLVIYYDMPPAGLAAQHREAVLDLFLPLAKDPATKGRLQNKRRRFVLQNTLNGLIDTKEVAHYCCFGCCVSREQTYEKIRKFAVAALLPSKLKLFAKNRWAQHFEAVSFCGLLAAYHGLLEPVLLAIKAVSGEDSRAKPATTENSGDAVLDMLADEMGLEAFDGQTEAATRVPDDQGQGLAAGHDDVQEDEAGANPAEIDWVTLNKQFKQKAGLWAGSRPVARLTFLAMSITAMERVMHAYLAMSGDEWEVKQRQLAMAGFDEKRDVFDRFCIRGQTRAYRLLVAARGQEEEKAFAKIMECLCETPLSLSQQHFTLHFRSLAFRLFSRVGSGLHWLLRVPHSSWPYALFKLLDGDTEVLSNTPACCLDELGAAYLQKYPADTCTYQPGTEEYAALAFLAENVHIDIAGIESRHAALRRLALKKSLQTWVTSFQHLSAEFTCRQVGACRVPEHRKESPGSAARPSDAKPANKKSKTEPKKSGGGGGAFRAYIHLQYRGQKGTPALWRQAGGFRAFGTNVPNESTGPRPGDVVAGGAIVAPDVARPNMEVVPLTGLDFKAELRKLSSECRSESRDHRDVERQQMEILRAGEAQLLATSEGMAIFPDVPVQETFQRGQTDAASARLQLEWFPPCAELAQACSQIALAEGLSDRARSSSRSWALRGKLLDAFDRETDMIRPKEQPAISFDPEVKKRMFSAKPCSKLGMCICGAAGNGHRAEQIHRRIAADLKRICWSRKKEKSPERQLLESGEIALRLHASDEAAATTELWYHVGYANYTTWRLTFHKHLRMPADAQPVGDAVCAWTSVQALAADFNFELPSRMSLYTIVDSPATVTFQRMKPGYVQVVACRSHSGDCLGMSIWKGQAAEDEDAAEQRGLRARARPSRESGPRPAGQQAMQTQRGRRRQAAVAAENDDIAEPPARDSDEAEDPEDADLAASAASDSGSESDPEMAEDGEEGQGLLEAFLAEMLPEPANSGHAQPDVDTSSDSDSSSSSSSSSTSSSSSRDSDCASASEAETEDTNADHPVAGPRAPPLSEHVFELEGGLGQIRYNVAQQQFIARCAVHGEDCRRRRTTAPSAASQRGGQGRPIGLLVSWLMRAHEEDTAKDHVKMKPSPLDDRVAAREAFYAMDGGRLFAESYEREQGEGEPEEPVKIYLLFLRKDVYNKEDARSVRCTVEGILAKQMETGPRSVHELLLHPDSRRLRGTAAASNETAQEDWGF
ncbi:unnamed protein product [Symbiodinium microadriaticum]|nr:unnamed protein product [Symbiodinium microadriaticum]